MAKKSKHSIPELRAKVSSPGGTTESAIAFLEKNHVRTLIKEAFYAAKKRSEELAIASDHTE